jgi:cell division protease FtsH
MELELGHVAFEVEPRSFLGPTGEPLRQRLYSEETAREIDCAVRKAVATAFARAEEILKNNRSVLEESARQLLVKETLESHELSELFISVIPAALDYKAVIPRCSCADHKYSK